MLKSILQTWNLTLVGKSPQLPAQLRTLREPSRTKRMTFRYKTSRWVDDHPATIGVISSVNEISRLALLAKSQSFISDKFISTEAVVKLNDTDLFRLNSRFLID